MTIPVFLTGGMAEDAVINCGNSRKNAEKVIQIKTSQQTGEKI
jgi:hypothetical protein